MAVDLSGLRERRKLMGGYEQRMEILVDLQTRLEQVQAENARLKYALRSIAKPSGAYSRDPAEYRKNVIDWCIETAEAALAEGES